MLIANEPEEIFPEREAATYPRNENDSKRAENRRETAKKHEKRVVKERDKGKRWQAQMSAAYMRVVVLGHVVTFFSYPGEVQFYFPIF